MKRKVKQLREGYRILEDVYSKSNRPIVPKNTVVTRQIIDVLEAFLIEEVHVDENNKERPKKEPPAKTVSEIMKSAGPENDKTKNSAESGGKLPLSEKNGGKIIATDLFAEYLTGVQLFKKEFEKWQNGLPVHIQTIREFFIPLLEKFLKYPNKLLMLQNFVERNDYIYHHCVSVGLITGYIAHKMNMKKGDCYQIALAGCLCDAGMAKMNRKIYLNKEISEKDYAEIKRHPVISYKMVKDTPSLSNSAKMGILQHHERLDGSGYPMGEKENIHPYAKMIAVADVYHALISARSYKDKVSPFKAIEMMMYDMVGKFDLSILQSFMSYIAQYSIHSHVLLSNGNVAKILFIDPKNLTRPIIKLVKNDEVISLENHKDLFIEEIIEEY